MCQNADSLQYFFWATWSWELDSNKQILWLYFFIGLWDRSLLYSSLSLSHLSYKMKGLDCKRTLEPLGTFLTLSFVIETKPNINSGGIGGHLRHWSWCWLGWDNTCDFMVPSSLFLSSPPRCLGSFPPRCSARWNTSPWDVPLWRIHWSKPVGSIRLGSHHVIWQLKGSEKVCSKEMCVT